MFHFRSILQIWIFYETVLWTSVFVNMSSNIGEIHYHKENKTNGGKQIEFSAETNQFEKKSGNK